jgi:hypothetical protein
MEIDTEAQLEAEEQDTLSADLATAWDAAEAAVDDEPVDEPAVDDEPAVEAPAEEPVAEAPVEAAPADDMDTPPKGLSLEAREEWSKAPPAIKKAIIQREKDYEAGIVQYSQNAKRAEAMDRTLAPFQQLFAMNGGAQNTIPGLLQTASILQMGAPAQKAQVVANLVKQFGVDVRALDNALVGAKPPADIQQKDQVASLLDERLAPLQQQLQQYQQRDQQMEQQQRELVNEELQKFAKENEFYNDVKVDMADLMDMATSRGRDMSLAEAYELACSAHPQIRNIMSARKSSQDVAAKRAASGSVRGGPGGTPGPADPGSRLAALNNAWDNAGRV